MQLRTRIQLAFVVSLVVALFLGSYVANADSAQGLDDPERFENEAFLPGLDIWVNQSTAAAQPRAMLADEQPAASQYVLTHYMLFPDSVDQGDFRILDPDVRLVFGLFGDPIASSGSIFDWNIDLGVHFGTAAYEDKSEAGLTSYQNREAISVQNYGISEVLSEDVAASYDMDWNYLNESTGIDNVAQNYTVPDNEVTGVAYEAGDDKSVTEWAKDISEADAATFVDVHNASMVGFAYENYDDLQAVCWGLDQDANLAASQPGLKALFKLKRAKVWLKSVKSSASKRWGTVKRSVDKNVFKPIKNVGSGIGAIPAKAKQFFTKTIPGAFQNLKNKVGSVFKGIFSGLKGPIFIIIGIIVVGGIAYLLLREKLFKQG